MLPYEGGHSGGNTGAGDLAKGAGALKRFQSRIDKLLTEFENGPGGTSKVAQQTIARTSFSGGNLPFAEADGFFTQYNRVHKELVSLSKFLGDQIEMLRIAVHASEVGLDNVDEDMRRRFHTIDARLREAHAEQEARERAQQGNQQPRNDAKTGMKDLG
ncbi:hypothetical protein [Streptomyces sp. TRM64462]|uniref:hypothetical protein n=1 Tax=Streptomyces sp. TRM64462 TaxID=2741726 RepID=UPI00158662B5|nr:hypothetical protein [Streptomyces sp. TRM64462]